jgi:nucleoid-associated protein YgaU
VTFRWGSVNLPQSVPVSLTVQYVHFHANGEPIRATVELELAQAMKAEQGQNPTTRGVAGLRVHRLQDGDSLASLAHDAYDDPTRWRAIAEANGIDDPMALRRGMELSIPRLDG